jgi:hypothetical protein
MADEKKPKWELSEALNSGKESLLLLETYGTELTPRLQVGEKEQHTANVAELEERQSGQKQTLAGQMSSTSSQDAVINNLNKTVASLRKVVMGNNSTEEIRKAFAIGTKITHSVSSATAAGKIVQDAYAKYPDWCKKAGILESDITAVSNLIKLLGTVEKEQDGTVYTRKSKTMSKNSLQRAVEDGSTRISVIGAHHFLSNPAVAAQFDALIPTTPEVKPKDSTDDKKV